jgi:hypothetical protein
MAISEDRALFEMRKDNALRFDGDLNHTISSLAEELVRLGDLVQRKRMR